MTLASRPLPRRFPQLVPRPLILLWLGLVALGTVSLPCRGAFADEDDRRVFAAETRVDTVAAGFGAALAAARLALEEDDWRFTEDRSERGRLVTEWKRLRHALVRLTLGAARARCIVDVTALGHDRTAIALRGAIASDRDIEGSPAYHLAELTYRKAADGWFERVHELLEGGQGAESAAPGGSSGAAAGP